MIQLEMTSKIHRWNAFFDGALIAKGTVTFEAANEANEAKEMIRENVAKNFGTVAKEIYVSLH